MRDESGWLKGRIAASNVPPAANGMTILIGLVG